ncbi:MAG TPA: beta-galactosidase [Candidatus Binataceae bacterium]|nr:beta-galactosidase [Candidatus Binataceae bacterium]
MRREYLIGVFFLWSIANLGRVGASWAFEPDEPLYKPLSIVAVTPAAANGIYVLDGIHNGKIDSAVMDSADIDGVLAGFSWTVLEPTEGKFNWKLLDSILRQAAAGGKKVSLVLGAGWLTPTWVYADGAQKFNFIWDQASWGPKLCSVATIPVPWDPVYLTKWAALVAAAGARYGNNPTIASIKITGINSKTQELFLPTAVKQPINGGKTSCVSDDDVADWQTAGYTPAKVESAFASVMEMFVRAFPENKLEAMLTRSGFPPIDDNGNRYTPSYGRDSEVTDDFASSGLADYPAQFTLQNNGWTATTIWATETSYASRITTGYQEGTVQGSQTPAAITLALSAGPAYLEFYENDALNPAVQSALVSAHHVLQ